MADEEIQLEQSEDQPESHTERPPFDGSLNSVLGFLDSVLEDNPRASAKQAIAALQEQVDALPEADGPEAVVGSALDQFEGLVVADDGSQLSWQGVDYVRGGLSLLDAAARLEEQPRIQTTRARVARQLRDWAQSG